MLCHTQHVRVQNVIRLRRDLDHAKKAERQETELHLKSSAQCGCRNELMRWLIYMAFLWQLCFYGDLDYE